MYEDGIYLSHGPDDHALVLIRENNGETLWIRNFVNAKAALDILEDDVLSNHNRADLERAISSRRGFFSTDVVKPDDGYQGVAFKRYIPEKH